MAINSRRCINRRNNCSYSIKLSKFPSPFVSQAWRQIGTVSFEYFDEALCHTTSLCTGGQRVFYLMVQSVANLLLFQLFKSYLQS
jgi:hypothetical protein